jgi:Tol biopolymer transport system component/DNA-binding winged helix-turn-helix (wHTH) protein
MVAAWATAGDAAASVYETVRLKPDTTCSVPSRYRWDDYVLDLDAYRLERGGVAVALEPKAFNLLAVMVQRPGHLFTKQEIFDLVWPGTAVTDHALTRIVAQIRRALGDEAREARFLETVPTRGYRWIHPVETVDAVGVGPVFADGPRAVEPATHASLRVPRVSLVPVIALAVAVVVALVWVWRDEVLGREAAPAAGGHAVQWPVQLTTHAGLDLHPALSLQNDAIAYVSDRTGSFEIVVRALDGSATETPLTSDGAQNVQPAWSPDGRFIAYHSQRGGGIWIVPSRGGTPKRIVAEGSRPAWSPDGAQIAFQSDEHADAAPFGFAAQNGSTIQLITVDGGAVTTLTRSGNPTGGHAAPTWSPDGRYICFAVFDSGPSNGLWLLERKSGAVRILHRRNEVYESVFAPDASSIYIAGGDALIMRLPFDAATGSVKGSPEIIPVPGVPGVRGLSISSDGTRLAFAGLGLSSQIWAQPVHADGSPAGEPRALTSDTSRRNSVPVISPDGTKVAYMSSRRGERPNLWMMDVDGQHPLQLTSDNEFESQPEWSSDGRRILYLAQGGNDERVLAVDVATRTTRPIVPLAALRASSAASPPVAPLAEVRLSRSATRVAFSLRDPPTGRRVLYATNLEPLSPRRLTDGSTSVGYPSWSPDERYIAVEIKEGSSTQAGVIDVETGILRRLTNASGQTWVRSWSPDGRRLAAAVLRDGKWSVRGLDVRSGRDQIITPPGPPRVFVRYPDWSARGDLIVFERSEMTGNIWLLDRPADAD